MVKKLVISLITLAVTTALMFSLSLYTGASMRSAEEKTSLIVAEGNPESMETEEEFIDLLRNIRQNLLMRHIGEKISFIVVEERSRYSREPEGYFIDHLGNIRQFALIFDRFEDPDSTRLLKELNRYEEFDIVGRISEEELACLYAKLYKLKPGEELEKSAITKSEYEAGDTELIGVVYDKEGNGTGITLYRRNANLKYTPVNDTAKQLHGRLDLIFSKVKAHQDN